MESPFMIGWPLTDRRFVHVLDELTLDILLGELDTISDFVDYLTKKAEFISTRDTEFVICGEEELLCSYLINPLADFGGFAFPSIPEGTKTVLIEEGDWAKFAQSNAYREWKKFNQISYEWDRLIEHQTRHVQYNSAQVVKGGNSFINDINAHERVLREMASEGRSVRRVLAEAFKQILTRVSDDDRLVTTIVVPNRPRRAYVLLVLRQLPGQTEEDYRELRRGSLASFCLASKLRIDGIAEVVGIASNHYESQVQTQDFLFIEFDGAFSKEENEEQISLLRAAGVWKEDWKAVQGRQSGTAQKAEGQVRKTDTN